MRILVREFVVSLGLVIAMACVEPVIAAQDAPTRFLAGGVMLVFMWLTLKP